MPIPAEEIVAILAAEAGIDPERLESTATLKGLDISSLDLVSAVFELEDRFKIEVDPEKIDPEFTVAQLIAYIQGIAEVAAKP
jgi:acyl carrier protein